MFKNNKKYVLPLKLLLVAGVVLGIGGNFFFTELASAQSCPANTTVSGTTVNFVGELTDMGGDSTTFVWFEYGQTVNYGYKTIEKVLTAPGLYCITVTGLSPSTTYHYRAAARNSSGTSYGENRSFTTTVGLSVDIKANNSDGPITIPYNSAASLTWTSSGASSCYASNAWSGTKAVSGSQSTGSLTQSGTYTITCTSAAGSVSDSVIVNVSTQTFSDFSVNKTARNLSQGTGFSNLVYASPKDILSFGIVVQAGSEPLYNVIVKDTLPAGLVYQGDLKIDNISTGGDIFTGLNIGNLSAGQKKTITFRVGVAGPENFGFGQTELKNTVLVSGDNISRSDTADIFVIKTAVAGVATEVATGLTNNIFIDSFLLPLIATLFIIWLFESRIIRFEEWLDVRKKDYQNYKSNKILQIKIARVKTRDFLRRIL